MEQYNKPPRTFSQQVNLLTSRGLIITDRFKAEFFLNQINYYRFSAYYFPFETTRHQFAPNVHFEQVQTLYVEIMSFGSLSVLVAAGVARNDQIVIARKFDLHSSILTSWLHAMAYIRNICAHHARLWNRELAIAVTLPRGSEWQSINPKRVGSVIFALNKILGRPSFDVGAWQAWRKKLEILLSSPPPVPNFHQSMGLPADWQGTPLWVQK